jgi:hypothetical protein
MRVQRKGSLDASFDSLHRLPVNLEQRPSPVKEEEEGYASPVGSGVKKEEYDARRQAAGKKLEQQEQEWQQQQQLRQQQHDENEQQAVALSAVPAPHAQHPTEAVALSAVPAPHAQHPTEEPRRGNEPVVASAGVESVGPTVDAGAGSLAHGDGSAASGGEGEGETDSDDYLDVAPEDAHSAVSNHEERDTPHVVPVVDDAAGTAVSSDDGGGDSSTGEGVAAAGEGDGVPSVEDTVAQHKLEIGGDATEATQA